MYTKPTPSPSRRLQMFAAYIGRERSISENDGRNIPTAPRRDTKEEKSIRSIYSLCNLQENRKPNIHNHKRDYRFDRYAESNHIESMLNDNRIDTRRCFDSDQLMTKDSIPEKVERRSRPDSWCSCCTDAERPAVFGIGSTRSSRNSWNRAFLLRDRVLTCDWYRYSWSIALVERRRIYWSVLIWEKRCVWIGYWANCRMHNHRSFRLVDSEEETQGRTRSETDSSDWRHWQEWIVSDRCAYWDDEEIEIVWWWQRSLSYPTDWYSSFRRLPLARRRKRKHWARSSSAEDCFGTSNF